MARILYDTQTATLRPYPRQDDEPVIDLDPRYLIMDLIQEAQPEYDTATQRIEPTEVIDMDALTVTRGWQLVDLPPPPPVADWDTFVAWIYLFPPMMASMETARSSTDPQGEPATTGLPAAMDEARLRQNYPAFAQTWGQFLLASQMAPADLAAIVGKAAGCNLPAEFVAALQPSATP